MAPIHILILGGDVKFLPVAKSKVRALASRVGDDGYASEKLIIEGTTILVEVKKGIQRITMSGSGDLFMDSGAVDIQTVSALDPAMGETDGILNYNATQQAQALDGKLLGSISTRSLAGTPPESGTAAESFKAKVTDGARVEDSEALLATKKLCSKLAPPSQFTGKMRLFIQAKYGQRLSAWPFTLNTGNQPPSLDTDNFQYHPGLCGIYTDTLMRHWLVQIGIDGVEAYEGVTIHRLKSEADVLRGFLLDDTRSVEQRERIEAYILSASRPIASSKVQFPMTIPARLSLGYGWHFSWSGASADIVDHQSLPYGSGLQYEASHYRLSISLTEETWSVEMNMEERATWGNSKWKTVIAYPDWGESKLLIFGSTLGLKSATEAPVYCFWRREGGAEQFEMVRYSYKAGIAATRGAWISNPPYYYGMKGEAPGVPTSPGCANEGLSMGLEETRYDSITYPETATTSSFSWATESVDVSSRSQSSSGLMGTEKSAVRSGGSSAPGFPAQPIQNGPGGMPTFDNSSYCPTGSYGGAHGPTTGTTPWGGTLTSYDANITWTQYSFTESVTETFASLLVIPFGDAEAVYVYGKEYSLVETTRTTTRAMASGGVSRSYIEFNAITDGGGNVFEWYDTGAGLDSDYRINPAVPDGTIITTGGWATVASKLVSNAGVLDTTWEPGNAFFAGDPTETVDEQLFTLSSTGGDVKGEEIDLTGDYPAGVNTAPFVFVGWA